jgi:hypothetical protein
VPSLATVIRGHGGPPAPPPTKEELEEAEQRYGARLPVPTTTPFRPDPREVCLYPRPCFFDARAVLVAVTASFDLTDELMRLSGQDPYRYEKARFLTATRDLRARLGARAHADDVRASAAELRRRSSAIGCDPTRSVAERRALLQALRDELDDATSEGRAAAAVIDGTLARLRARGDAGSGGCAAE